METDKHSRAASATNADEVMTFGKYEGYTLLEVYQENPGYLEWIVENFDDGPKKEMIEEFLEDIR